MPKSMQVNTGSALSTILQIDKTATANVANQLDATGVLGVAEAYISGWTMQDIAKALGGSVVAVMQWENGLKKEDKDLLREAKTVNLEQLEAHLSKLQQSELTRMEESGDLEEDIKRANLTDKRLQAIQRVLSATQQQLERYQKASADRDVESRITQVINQIVVADPNDRPPLPQ